MIYTIWESWSYAGYVVWIWYVIWWTSTCWHTQILTSCKTTSLDPIGMMQLIEEAPDAHLERLLFETSVYLLFRSLHVDDKLWKKKLRKHHQGHGHFKIKWHSLSYLPIKENGDSFEDSNCSHYQQSGDGRGNHPRTKRKRVGGCATLIRYLQTCSHILLVGASPFTPLFLSSEYLLCFLFTSIEAYCECTNYTFVAHVWIPLLHALSFLISTMFWFLCKGASERSGLVSWECYWMSLKKVKPWPVGELAEGLLIFNNWRCMCAFVFQYRLNSQNDYSLAGA